MIDLETLELRDLRNTQYKLLKQKIREFENVPKRMGCLFSTIKEWDVEED